jgi:cell division protein FtsQ
MQQVWRKRWRSTGWVALAGITLVLLISAINRKNHKICQGIEVSFHKDGSNFFVDEKGITSMLKSFGPIKGLPIENINLGMLEDKLRSDRWIANAELFFDNKQVLQVIVEEKEPVARIFTVSGSSFYIDSACKKLQLSEKLSARIPMFTNFPSDRSVLSKPDSELLASAKELAMFIQSDDFWKAQVAQIDVTTSGFEMIPTMGSHVVMLGKNGNWQQKFDRLFSFYKQVWTQVGFEKYEKLDVQFNGQVVATVKGAKPAKVDSAKARMAYETILAEVKKLEVDSIAAFAEPVRKLDSSNGKATSPAKAKEDETHAAPVKKSAPQRAVLKAAPKRVVQKASTVKMVSKATVATGVARSGAVRMAPKAVMKPFKQVKNAKK